MMSSLHYSYLGYVHGYLGYVHGYLGCGNLMNLILVVRCSLVPMGRWYPGSWCVVLKLYLNV